MTLGRSGGERECEVPGVPRTTLRDWNGGELRFMERVDFCWQKAVQWDRVDHGYLSHTDYNFERKLGSKRHATMAKHSKAMSDKRLIDHDAIGSTCLIFRGVDTTGPIRKNQCFLARAVRMEVWIERRIEEWRSAVT